MTPPPLPLLRVEVEHRFPRGAGIPSSSVELRQRFEAPLPGVVALFGPSGSGKTSVVQAVAGLFRPDACKVEVDGAVLADTARGIWIPPERRRLGVVFQDGRLFPHMSVERNLRYGLRRAPPGPVRFDDVVDLLGIGALLGRRPHTLSGGERQRVAIGRALLAQPRLLLMDEPLASLDAPRRAEILPYLARLRDGLRVSILYVTHALDEVARLADTLVLVEEGQVVAAGPVADIAARGDLSLARRDDAGAVLHARVIDHDAARGLTRLDVGAGTPVLVPQLPRAAALPGGMDAPIRLRIPAREVALARQAPAAISMQNALPGRVRAISEDAGHRAVLVEVATGRAALLARITPDAVMRLDLAPGRPCVALFKSVSVEVLTARAPTSGPQNPGQPPALAARRMEDGMDAQADAGRIKLLAESVEATPFQIPGAEGEFRIQILNEDEARGVVTSIVHLPVGGRIPAHYHDAGPEMHYVLEGDLIEAGESLGVGGFLTHAPGQVHGPHESRGGAKVLTVQQWQSEGGQFDFHPADEKKGG